MKHSPRVYQLDLRELVKINVNCLEFFGYFIPEYDKRIKKIFYYIYSILFVGSVYVLLLLSEIINTVLVFGDMEKMTEGSFVLLTHVVEGLKLSCFIRHGPRVRKLIKSFNREEFKPRNSNQYKILLNDINISKQTTKVFLFMCCVTCCLWGIFPFFDKKPDGKIRLPLSGWFPFDINQSPVFEFVYIYQIIGVMITGLSNISMDTFLSGTIMVISGQLSLLNNNLELMRQKYRKKIEVNNEAKTEVRNELIRNIFHYRQILQLSDEITYLFTNVIMAQFIVSVVILCITMFQMSLVPVLSVQFLSMSLYQSCILLEIFLWCYYGNDVILKSEKLTQSAYMSEWFNSNKEFRNNLLFFMTRSQIPLKLYAGGYFSLSLDTFMAILKSSWSYFAVLNRIHSQK